MNSLLEIAALASTTAVARVDEQVRDLVRDFRTPHPVFQAQIASVILDSGTIMRTEAGETIRVRFRSVGLSGEKRRRFGAWQAILAVDFNRWTTIGIGYSNTPSRLPEVHLETIWPVLRGVESRRAARFVVWAERPDVPHTMRVSTMSASRWAKVARYLARVHYTRRYVPTITT